MGRDIESRPVDGLREKDGFICQLIVKVSDHGKARRLAASPENDGSGILKRWPVVVQSVGPCEALKRCEPQQQFELHDYLS